MHVHALLEEQVRRARSDDAVGCKPTSTIAGLTNGPLVSRARSEARAEKRGHNMSALPGYQHTTENSAPGNVAECC